METAIVLRDVSRHYGATRALDRLTVSFPRGALTGFLGPNGAGKTTTFRSILGLTRPQSGEIEVLGMRVGIDTPRIVKRVGAVVEEPGLHKTLSAVDNLRVAALTLGFGAENIDDLIFFVGLADEAHRKVGVYSKGMRQRLALAMAMLGDPEILILDEPLDGLDPAGQVAFKARLRELVTERGRTVIVSSHELAHVEALADRVVVINHGRLIAEGTLDQILGDGAGIEVRVSDPGSGLAALAAAGLVARVVEDAILVATEDGSQVSRVLADAGLYPSFLAPRRSSLEQVFLGLTGDGQ